VGVITDTILMNPEFGNLGPRLSPRDDLAVFSPDYLAEKLTLAQVLILGLADERGSVSQGVPPTSVQLDSLVRVLSRDEIISFHQPDGRLQLGYLPTLAAVANRLTPHLLKQIIAQVGRLFPQEARMLSVLENNLDWESRVRPSG